MKPLKNSITTAQQINIRKHVDFLCFDKRVTFDKFGMLYYGNPQCGTGGCSAGWMIVSMNDLKAPHQIYRFFGIPRSCHYWIWCFSSSWNDTDNTAIGAAARLLYLLEYGLPNNFAEIMEGNTPYPKRIIEWIEKVKQMKRGK